MAITQGFGSCNSSSILDAPTHGKETIKTKLLMVKSISFNVDEMLSPLRSAYKVINGKNTMPILDCIVVKVNGGKVSIIAADIETWVEVTTNIYSKGAEDYMVCVGGADFVQALGTLNGLDITMQYDEEKRNIVLLWSNGNMELPTQDASEYPLPYVMKDDKYTFTIDGRVLYNMFNKTIGAIATDELRPVMCGVHFDLFKDSIVCVATNGRWLVKERNTSVTNDNENGTTPNFTISRKPSTIITDFINNEDVVVSFDGTHAQFQSTYFTLSTRLIDGRYPNYDSVIPREHKHLYHMDRKALMSALKHVMPSTSKQGELISLSFNVCDVDIQAQDVDYSRSAQERIGVQDVDASGEEKITIGFNGSILSTCLGIIESETVCMELMDATRAGVIYAVDNEGNTKRDEELLLIMPMKIG